MIFQKFYPLPELREEVTEPFELIWLMDELEKWDAKPSLRYRISRNHKKSIFQRENGEEDKIRREWYWRKGEWIGNTPLKFEKFQEKQYCFKKGLGFLNQCPSNWGRGDRISLYFDRNPNWKASLLEWVQLAPPEIEWGVGGQIGIWDQNNPKIRLSMKNLTPPRKIKFLKYIQALFRKLKVCEKDFKSKE
jgi:hypothetical protein